MATAPINSALSDAIEHGNLDAVVAIIDKHPELLKHSDWTPPPLHCAILWGQPEVAELLLDRGADIEMLDPDRQTTPLRYAIMFCKSELIPLLLSRGANTGAIAESELTALQLARTAAQGKYEQYDDLPGKEDYSLILSMLLDAGLID